MELTRNPSVAIAFLVMVVIFVSGCVSDAKPSLDSFSLSPGVPHVGESVQITVAASDDKGLKSITIEAGDFTDTFSCNERKTCRTVWSLSFDAGGPERITITAVDTADQPATQSKTITIASDEPFCGDGVCNGDETSDTCTADCPTTLPTCGNGVCEPGEDSISCPLDCEEPSGLVPRTTIYGIFSAPDEPRAWSALADLGVGWVRLQFRMGEAEKDVQSVLEEGYGLWLNLYHRDRSNIADTATFDSYSKGGFPPVDGEQYKELVKETITPMVEYLRAQGKDPADWLVIQIENEVVPRDTQPPDNENRFWHGTEDEYLQTLSLGYDAVKSVDPSIPVASAGLVMEQVQSDKSPLGRWNSRLLTEGQFDWADVHLYNKIEDIDERVAWIKERWIGPLASSEIGGPDPAAGLVYSDQLQIEDIEQRIDAALDAGVDRVFWVTLVKTGGFTGRFEDMHLITADWQRKPAFETYRDLIAASGR